MRLIKAAFLSLGVAAVLVYLTRLNLFKISRVDIPTPPHPCATLEETERESNLLGQTIFFNPENVNKILTNKFPCIKKVEIIKHYPKSVVISITSREVLARILPIDPLKDQLKEVSVSSTSALIDWTVPKFEVKDYLVIDKTGLIFSQTDSTSSALLYLPYSDLKIGKKVNGFFDRIDSILTSVRDLGLNIIWLKINAEDLLINSNPRVIFDLKSDPSRQLGSLQLILQETKIDGRMIDSIDLRFDRPVVVYRNKK